MIPARAKSDGQHGRRRRLTRFLPVALVVGALLCSAEAFSQKTNNKVLDPIAEKKYWEAFHEREAKQRAADVDWENQQRDEIKMKIVEIVHSQEAIQSQMIVAQDGPSKFKPEEPSILQRHPEQVGLGLAVMLVLALVTQTVIRMRQEAEIRKLCGGYLSDGTEVASYKLPEWFAPAPIAAPVAEFAIEKNTSALEIAPPTPVVEFFEKASERLSGIRAALKELGNSGSMEDRQQTLTQAHALVCELRDKSTVWDLRPAWQMSSSLELLFKRILDKPKDLTPSVVRTLAAAVDVLHEVCVPGVRPNLLNDPPLKILAVDDDPLCRRALQFALEKANFDTDVAENGEKAVELALAHTYDVVFMDIQMPGIDGLAACEQIHGIKKNSDVPVIFVTVQSDFSTRAQTRLKGGADLMAKPFLVFELTVRAMTYAMRRRLQAAVVNRRDPLPMPSVTPILQIAPPAKAEATSAASVTTTAASPPPSGQPPAQPVTVNAAELAGDFLVESPRFLAEAKRIVEGLQMPGGMTDLEEHLGSLYLRVHTLAGKASLAKLPIAARVGTTLEALLKRLYRNPKIVTASTLNTAASALRLLEALCQPGTEEKLASDEPVRILVVDDEPLARRAVVGALQLAFKQPESAEDGTQAAALVARIAYDVIFTDAQMPGLDGFELCTAIRASNLNARTPVIFITSHMDVEAQAKATASGGNDFIGKPFLPIEITVKALTFAWEGRLKKLTSKPEKTVEPEPALVAA